MLKYLLFIFFLVFSTNSYSHSWYPESCCNGKDCSPIDCNEIITTKEGYKWKEYIITKDKVYPSKDNKCHICIPYSNPTCLFLQYNF